MSLNLSIKNVPDDLAEALRVRAARNHRSLQGELMAILEAAVTAVPPTAAEPSAPAGLLRVQSRPEPPGGWLTVEQVAERARKIFPEGTAQFGRSVDIIREMRDSRDGDHWRR